MNISKIKLKKNGSSNPGNPCNDMNPANDQMQPFDNVRVHKFNNGLDFML